MEHEGRCVGNRVNAYTSDMDFHGGSKLSKLTYPIKTIYSKEARVQLRKVLDDFKPDVCHLNNFNYQLTPSIILEIVKWRKETGRDCKIIFTAHDYQLVCPNHMLNNPNTHQNCEKCLGGHFVNCMKGKCIHGSTAKSAIGMMEAEFWKWKGTYKYIDTMICCSEFMKTKMDSNPLFATKTVAMHNFIDRCGSCYSDSGHCSNACASLCIMLGTTRTYLGVLACAWMLFLYTQIKNKKMYFAVIAIAAVVLVGIVLLSPIKEKFISASSRTEIGIDL